jgi:hypothetical protein
MKFCAEWKYGSCVFKPDCCTVELPVSVCDRLTSGIRQINWVDSRIALDPVANRWQILTFLVSEPQSFRVISSNTEHTITVDGDKIYFDNILH